MPEISREEVAHLATLARIDLSDAELDHLAPQLSVILESVASINGVAGDDVPPDVARDPADQRLPRGRGGARASPPRRRCPAPRPSRSSASRVPRILGEEA